jgi:dienelactone hydrolase
MQRLLSGLTVAALALAASAGTTSIGARSTHAAGVRYTDLIFPTVSATADVRYATAPDLVTGVPADLLLDIYEPAGDTVARRPALLAIHGGGFRVGDKGAVADWAREWSQRGYVVFAVNYRLDAGNMCQGLQDGQVPAEELAAEGARCRAAIEAAQYDSQAAVRWVRAHADTYRVDPTRIGAIGSSAGAITAVRLAQRSEFPGDIGDEDTFDSTVGAALAMSGCNNDPSSIDSGDSPVAIIHAENDPAVPFQCTLDTAAAAQADGVVADTMLWYGEATHAINLYRKYQTDIDPVWTAFLIRELHLADGPTPDSMIEIHGTPNRSAIVSLVATQTGGAGYLQALPCDASPGSTSNLNSDAGGQTRAGLAVVHFDSTGTSCVYRSMATEVVVDLQGYFATGQFDDRADTRLLDTRAGQAPAAGAMVVVRAEPNRSAVLSIVATDSNGPGYLQALPCRSSPGATSNLNVDGQGQTRAGLAVVPFAADGTACIYTSVGTHLVVDLQGYLAPGTFDDVTDVRLLDTRSGPRSRADSTTTVHGPPNTSAFVSLVATDTLASGYLTALPCSTTPGITSNLNADKAATTIAGAAVVRFDESGLACVYTSVDTHVVVDLQGNFTPGSFDDVADQRLLDTRQPT